MDSVVRVLLVVIAVLAGVVAGLLASGLAVRDGSKLSDAVARGAVAMGGTITIVLLIENQLSP